MATRTKRSLRAAVIAAASAGLVMPGTALAADPLTDPLYKFYGNVTDPIGRGIAGASVYDGAKTVTTAPGGAYELGERDFNKTYRLFASKLGMDTVSKDVAVTAPLDTRVDFTLQYRTTASIAKRYLSTAAGATATSVNVQTYAPNPGLPGQSGGASCVTVSDSGTGSTTDATYASTAPDGAVTWVWSLSLAAATPERSGTLTVRTVDCATGTVLARDTSVTYVVDNTPPVIRNVFPIDGTLSTFGASQQAGASFKDTGGAGVDSSTIGVTITDTVTGTTKAFAGSQVAYNATTGQATAGPTALTTDHRHRVSVTVKDRAGNTTTFGHRTDDGGFTPVSATVGAVSFRVPRVDCTLGQTDLMTRKRTVTCSGVTLSLDGSSVTLSQVPHAGYGFVNVNAPLTGIQLVLVQPTGNVVQYPYSGTKFHPVRFGTTSTSTTPVEMPTAGALLSLSDVNRQVEAPLASEAYLLLGESTLTPSLQGCAGQSTIAGAVTCLSDPLHSVVKVVVKSGQDAAQVAQSHAASYGIEVGATGDGQYSAIVPDAYVDDIRNDTRVLEVSRELPFSYHVPVAELVKNDITDTPAGQAAIASSGIAFGVGTCTGALKVFNMGMAAGTPSTGGDLATLVWPDTLPLSDVKAYPTGGNAFALEYGALSATSTTQANACDGGQWQQKSNGSCTSGRSNDVQYLACPSIWWLSNDNYADADFWAIKMKTTGRGVRSGYYLRKIGGETRPDQAKEVMAWEDFDPSQDIQGNCGTEITVGIEIKGVSLSGTKQYLCERWDATVWHSEDGRNANVWRGDVAPNNDRAAQHIGGVSIPATAGVQVIGWVPWIHACSSWFYWQCG